MLGHQEQTKKYVILKKNNRKLWNKYWMKNAFNNNYNIFFSIFLFFVFLFMSVAVAAAVPLPVWKWMMIALFVASHICAVFLVADVVVGGEKKHWTQLCGYNLHVCHVLLGFQHPWLDILPDWLTACLLACLSAFLLYGWQSQSCVYVCSPIICVYVWHVFVAPLCAVAVFFLVMWCVLYCGPNWILGSPVLPSFAVSYINMAMLLRKKKWIEHLCWWLCLIVGIHCCFVFMCVCVCAHSPISIGVSLAPFVVLQFEMD